MLKILLVSATEAEIRDVLNFNPSKKDQAAFNLPECLVTGPGMVATTYHLTRKLAKKKFDLVLNAGIAGSFKRDIPIGRVVHVVSDCFSDFGAEEGEGFLSAVDIGLVDPNQFPFENNRIKPTDVVEKYMLPHLKKVNAVTVNIAHGKKKSILNIIESLNPDTESMEGAAVFYVCAHEKVPCLQVRAISNYVERRNREAWNIPLAVKNLNKTLVQILNKLS
jgi:futalosine hydrolase